MRLDTVIASDDSDDAIRARIQRFLAERGYGPEGTTFVRGSRWGSLTSFNPKRWKARASIVSLSHGHRGLRFDVNTTGQILSDTERQFWQAELDATAAVGCAEPAQPLAEIEGKVKAAAWRFVAIVSACSVAGLIGFGALELLAITSHFPMSEAFVFVGPVVGAVIGLQLSLRKR